MVTENKTATASMTAKENTMATISAAESTQGPGLRIAMHPVAVRILNLRTGALNRGVRILVRQPTEPHNADVQILQWRIVGNTANVPRHRMRSQ